MTTDRYQPAAAVDGCWGIVGRMLMLMRTILPGLFVAMVVTTIVGCGEGTTAIHPPPPTPGRLPEDARPWPGIVWTSLRLAPNQGVSVRRLVAVATDGSVVVAVGYDDDGAFRSGRAISAGENMDFAPAANPDVMASIELVDVADGPDGFVAIGTEAGNPSQGIPNRIAIITSADGRTWRRVPDDPIFAGAYAVGIAPGPGGLLAIGASESGLEQHIWRSVDGTTWVRLATTELGLPAEGVASIDGSPTGWVAAGAPSRAVIADSVDGLTWHAAVPPPTGRKGVKPPIVVRAVQGRWGRIAMGFEPVDCGFLIWEGDCAAEPASWWSDGLGDWGALAEDSFMPTHPAARIVAAGDHGFVAVTGSGSWASVDGLTWLDLSSPNEPDVEVLDVVVLGDRIVAVGEAFSDDGRSSDGWIGVGGECCN